MIKTVCLALAMLCISGACWLVNAGAGEAVQTRWFVEVARPGDTFNGIVEQYYDNSIRSLPSWDEWQTEQKKNNEALFANGRHLQPGDKILIVTKVRVAK